MSKEYETWKCMTLIKMLIKRKQNPERALEVYSKSVYDRSMRKIEYQKQRRLMDYNNE